MPYKKWIIADADKEKASELSEKFNIDPFIAYMLVSRGIKSELEVSDFLSDSYHFSDPFGLADMDKAVSRIEQAIDYSEKITVYGDYDCDGVTATVLLVSLLKNMGAQVDYYIPSRESEGYGMNSDAVKQIHSGGTRLIITVDNGISAFEEAQLIYSLGMELIITDHHQIGDALPTAYAVINPHREDNSIAFRNFAGVGVAFKLACALYGDTNDMLMQFADLAALGTIGDVVPLVGENRSLVKAGLKMINSDFRLGIAALKEAAGIGDKKLSSTDVAFILCPRINAAGRIDKASRAAELLLSENYSDASFKAEQLNIDNLHRQELEQNIIDDVMQKIAENPRLVQDRVIVIGGENYHTGVVGIVASRVLEEFGKPTFIIGIDSDGNSRGSARSIEGFDIYKAISSCSYLLKQFGGHKSAAGVELSADNIDVFRRKINQYAQENYPVMPPQTLRIDCKLSPFYLNLELAQNLTALEPYGEANPKAVFALTGLTLVSVKEMGNAKHIRLECEKKGRKIRIVKFGCSAEEFPYVTGDRIDVAVRVSKNIYNGREYLSVQAVDIRRNGTDDDKYFKQKADYEMFCIDKSYTADVYPDRAACSAVYKYLKANGGWRFGFDELYFAIGGVTYGALKFALKAFEESGLISYNGSIINICRVFSKVDLMNTPAFKELKGRLSIG